MTESTCPRCGTSLGASRFCTNCGFDLSAHPGTPYCVACTEPLGPLDRFCRECGTDQIAPAPESSARPQQREPHVLLIAALVLVPLLIAAAGAALLLWHRSP